MSLTITIPGAVNVTTGSTAPAVLTIGVGVPGAAGPQGPAGPGVPVGGTAGQFLTKIDGTNYNTDWTTVNLAAYAVKANNLSDLTNFTTARTNLGLGGLAVLNDAPSDGSQYARKNGAWDVVSAGADFISSVTAPLAVTSGNLSVNLSAYAPLASPLFTGDARAVTPAFGDNDTSIATTAFVQAGLLGGTAVARNLEVEVRNQSGSTIPAGSIVYISGATGNLPLITLAQANNDTNSAQTIGFVKTAIANNGTGYVIVRGELQNIDTSALTEGVQLYLSPTVAGTWTTTKPSAPQHLVYVGVVIRSHPTLGTILVAVQNGYELDELHDVAIASKANNDLLAYEASTDLWKNKTYSALGLLTSSAAASTYAPIASPNFTGNVSLGSGVTSFTLNPTNTITIPVGLGVTESTLLENRGLLVRDSSNIPVARFQAQEVLIPSVGITFSDLSVQTSAGISAATAASTYQTIAGMSSYAPKASPALTGNVTITSNTTGAALFIEQAGTGNILTLHDQASDTNFVAIDQNGKVSTIPSDATAGAGFNIAHGTAPTSPVNGDVWTNTTAMFVRINAATQQLMSLSATQTVSGSITFSNANLIIGNSTAAGTIAIGNGATVSGSTKSVNIATNGAAGSTTNVTIGSTSGASTIDIGPSVLTSTFGLGNGNNQTGATKTVNIGTNGTTGTTAINIGSTAGTTITVNGATTFTGASQTLGNSTAASTVNIGTGATLTATTKAVNIGTGGVAGSTTNIAIGSVSGGTSTTTMQGTTNFSGPITGAINNASIGTGAGAQVMDFATGVTGTGLTKAVSIGTNGAAGSTTTIAIGGTAGTSTTTLNGTTNGVTAAADTNSVALATTAYVVGQAGSATPLVNGTAAVGTSLRYARQDHVHGTDTTRAPLASPTFTGTPTLPTGTIATTQTVGNNTTAVATTAFVTAAVPAAATVAEAKVGNDTTKFINCNILQKVVNSPSYYKFPRGVMSTATSGTGAAVTAGALNTLLQGTTTGAGWAQHEYYGFSGVDVVGGTGWTVGAADINFSKQMRLTGSTNLLGPMPTNTIVRCMFGKQANDAGGDPATKFIGWRYSQSTGFIEIFAHNGTSLVTLTTASNPVSGSWFEWELYNNGSGSVQMFVNDVSIGTLTGGPTGNTFASAPTYVEEIQTTATPSAQPSVRFRNGGLFLQP